MLTIISPIELSKLKGFKKLKNPFVSVIREDANVSNVFRGTLDGMYFGASVSLNYVQGPRLSIVLERRDPITRRIINTRERKIF